MKKVQKERILEGSEEKITPSSHTVSQWGEAEPSGTLWQTTNHDHEAIVVVLEVDVVYPLHGDSAIEGESTSGYLVGEQSIKKNFREAP